MKARLEAFQEGVIAHLHAPEAVPGMSRTNAPMIRASHLLEESYEALAALEIPADPAKMTEELPTCRFKLS